MQACIDLHGRTISPGIHYVPGPDTCTLCICDNGDPKWCKAVLCSPPQDCKSFRVGNSCCEFICLDDTLAKGEDYHELSTDLGLRLVATAITIILCLSLLFFLIHRLRQRKIRGRQNREMQEERSLGSIGYIAESLGYLGEAGYEEGGGQYPVWKPAYYRGEAPPPYEEAVAAGRVDLGAGTRHPGPSAHRTIPAGLPLTLPLPSPQPSALPTVTPEVETRRETMVVPTVQPHPTSSHIPEELDDYRSECENCNISAQQLNGELEYEEDLQTMTLHRRTLGEGDQQPFYRTSLTLPTQVRKQRTGVANGVAMSCARENWFSSMPESSSSEEEE